MNWFSHRVFAVGLAAVCKFNYAGIAAAYVGSTIPDGIDFFLAKMGADFNKIHRKHSHAWIWYALILALGQFAAYPYIEKYFSWTIQYKEYLAAFFMGIFSHIFLDMLTIKGVPAFINPNKKIAFKIIRTNRFSEFTFTLIFFTAVCIWLYYTKNPYISEFIGLIARQL